MVGRAVPAAVLNPRAGAGERIPAYQPADIPAYQPADTHPECHGRAPSSPRPELLPSDLVLRHRSLDLRLRR
nr:unnamed protein product [Digitaria exilis]